MPEYNKNVTDDGGDDVVGGDTSDDDDNDNDESDWINAIMIQIKMWSCFLLFYAA